MDINEIINLAKNYLARETRIKSLVAEYEQAETRVEKLEQCIEALRSGKSKVVGILIYTDPYYGPNTDEDIADCMDKNYINTMYQQDIISGMEYEIKDHKKLMNELIQDIKKELQL